MSHSPCTAPEHFARDLEAARGGCRESLGRLMTHYYSYLAFLVNAGGGWPKCSDQSVVDLVQEACRRALTHFDKFQGSTHSEFKGWMRRILINVARDYRGERARRPVPLPPGYDPATDETPMREAVRTEDAQTMRRALAQCTAEEQEAMMRRVHDRWTWEQIGHHLGMSAEAARKLMERLRCRLIAHLGGRQPTA